MNFGLGSGELRAQIEVVTLAPDERRMLLEMLASERAGEAAVHVGELHGGELGRHRTARRLVDLRMTRFIADDRVVFTAYGRHLAESLACRLIRVPDPHAS
jgi:hypothetical protein